MEVREVIEREKRRKRVVIDQLVNEDDSEEVMRNKTMDLFEVLAIPSEEIDQISKLRDKPMIYCRSKKVETTQDVLRKARHEKDFSHVYKRPDLTYKQRQEGQRLRHELKMRLENGE